MAILTVQLEARVPLEGTAYEVGVDTVRHRIAQKPPGTVARSMITCSVVLWKGGREVFRAHVEVGETARYKELSVRPTSVGEKTAELEVELPKGKW